MKQTMGKDSLQTLLGVSAVASISLFTSLGSAAEASTGFEVGLRLGYAIPFGTLATSNGLAFQLSDLVFVAVPVILDLGYRVTPNISLGLYGQYAFGILNDDLSSYCDTTRTDCSVSSVRAGLQASYVVPLNRLEAWFGLVLGIERLNTLSEGSANSGTLGSSSLFVTLPEFGLQGGTNIKLSSGFSIGPFLSFSMGRYSWGNATYNGQSQHTHLPESNRAPHEWLILGVRGVYMP
jgi:hypothetical protein